MSTYRATPPETTQSDSRSSAEYAGAIRRARPFGFARFRGDNVRLSGVRVRKPKSKENDR